MKKAGKLDRLRKIILPKDWSTSRDGGPRKFKITSKSELSEKPPLGREAEIRGKPDHPVSKK